MIQARLTVKYWQTMNDTMTLPIPTPRSLLLILLKAMTEPPLYACPMAISRIKAGIAMRKMASK